MTAREDGLLMGMATSNVLQCHQARLDATVVQQKGIRLAE